jgi:DNA-binding PucR family transcriptional regulator
MNAAAAAIPSHRHTVAYRLERLRELTGLHPAHVDDRERLGLGVKAQVVLDALAEVR